MPSPFQPGRIHVSAETAEQLRIGGKGSWVAQREDKIVAKGKGELQTYWLIGQKKTTMSVASDSSKPSNESDIGEEEIEASTSQSRRSSLVGLAEDKATLEQKPLPPKLQRLVK